MATKQLLWCAVLVLASACGDDDGGGGGDTGPGGIDSGSGREVDSGPGGDIDSGPTAEMDSGPGREADTGPGGGIDAGPRGPDSGIRRDAGPMMCMPAGMSCADGRDCCGGLECCSGTPVLPGMEYCATAGSCPESDRNVKHGFASVEPEEVLARVSSLEISTWSYDDEPGVRHMGPMAQDFSAAFGLGADDRHIFVLDANGVTMASIQALAARTEALARENESLRRENAEMREAVRRIEARLDAR